MQDVSLPINGEYFQTYDQILNSFLSPKSAKSGHEFTMTVLPYGNTEEIIRR